MRGRVGRHVRRAWFPVVALVVAATIGSASGIDAQTAPPPAAPPTTIAFDGTVAGTGSIGAIAGCGLDLSVTFETTVALTAGGTAALQMAVCNSLPEPGVPGAEIYGQTFVLTTADGTVAGTLSGRADESEPDSNEFPLHLDLVATGGTGSLAGADGSLTFDGVAGPAGATVEGTLSGSLTLVPPTTTTTVAVTVTSVPAGPPTISPAGAAQPVVAAPTFTG